MKRPEDKPLERSFAERLRIKMDEYGYSTEDFELDSVCASSSMRKYLEGVSLPTLRTAYRIADYLGTTLDYLCGFDDITSDEQNVLSNEYDAKREAFYSALDNMKMDDSEAPWGRLNV